MKKSALKQVIREEIKSIIETENMIKLSDVIAVAKKNKKTSLAARLQKELDDKGDYDVPLRMVMGVLKGR